MWSDVVRKDTIRLLPLEGKDHCITNMRTEIIHSTKGLIGNIEELRVVTKTIDSAPAVEV